jgi:hypothetical protein
LARRFEEYEPDEANNVPVEEYLLRTAALKRSRVDRQVVEAIVPARSARVSWSRIGEILGTSAQAAQRRYGPVAEQV